MSRILATADLHLTENKAETYRHNFIKALPDIIKRREIDGLLINGDLTEEKDRHSAQLVNQVVDEIATIATMAPVIINMGNHDYLNEGSPFFAFLSKVPRVHFITKNITGEDLPITFRAIFDGCLFLPHTRDWEKAWSSILKWAKGYRFIFAHQTFNDAAVGWGRKLEGIPTDIFKGCRVVAGDIHVPQTLGPITYIGAPYTVNFGDAYEARLLSLEGKIMKSIGVSAWPQKKLVEADQISDLKKVKLNPGDIVKIRLSVEKMTDWPALREAAAEWARRSELEVYRIEPVVIRGATNKRHKIKAQGDSTDAAILEAYAKRHTLEANTLKVGLELIKP